MREAANWRGLCYPHPMDQIILVAFIALGAAAVLTALYLWPPRIG